MTQDEYINHHTEASVELLAEIILADREHLYITDEHWIPRGEERVELLNVLLSISIIHASLTLYERIVEIKDYLVNRTNAINVGSTVCMQARMIEMEYQVSCYTDKELIYHQNVEFHINAAVAIRGYYLGFMKDEILNRFDCTNVINEKCEWTKNYIKEMPIKLTIKGNTLIWN